MIGITPGDVMYLTPRTLTAPAIAWKQPRVTVVRVGNPMADVRLPDGSVVKVHRDNLVHRLPEPTKPSDHTTLPRHRPLKLAPGEKEIPLW